MRNQIAFAVAIMAAQATAFEWNEVIENLQSFEFAKAADSFSNAEWSEILPEVTTRADARKWIAEHGDRKIKPLTMEHRRAAITAHHNIMARRERLGMPKVGAAAGPRVG